MIRFRGNSAGIWVFFLRKSAGMALHGCVKKIRGMTLGTGKS